MRDEIIDFLSWFEKEKFKIEEIHYNAFVDIMRERRIQPREINAAAINLSNLSKGLDANYNSENLDLAYLSWYSLKRIGDNLLCAYDILSSTNKADKLMIYDIGAGSLAVCWSLAIVSNYLQGKGHQHAFINYHPCDNSNWASRINELTAGYLESCKRVRLHPISVCDWRNLRQQADINAWVIIWGSYPFSGQEVKSHSVNQTAVEMLDLAVRLRADEVILTTSQSKATILTELGRVALLGRWMKRETPLDLPDFIKKLGVSPKFYNERKRLYEACNFCETEKQREENNLLSRWVTWMSEGYSATAYLNLQKI